MTSATTHQQAFLFPDQGGESVGMGRDLCNAYPAACYVFQEVEDTLHRSLSTLLFEGPAAELERIENAQSARLALTLAWARALEERLGAPLTEHATLLAGYGVGEYAALTVAGSLSVADAVRLVDARARWIAEIAPPGTGGMVTLTGMRLEEAREWAESLSTDGEFCTLAADHAPQEQCLSGHAGVLAKAETSRALSRQNVSIPWHSSILRPAAERLEQRLQAVTISPAGVPVVANASATPQKMPDGIRRCLAEQLCTMVRWRETAQVLGDYAVTRTVEVGPGRMLSRLMRCNLPDVPVYAVASPYELETFISEAVLVGDREPANGGSIENSQLPRGRIPGPGPAYPRAHARSWDGHTAQLRPGQYSLSKRL